MLPKDLTRDIKNRLKSISGQVDGITRMLDEDKSPKAILLQLKSVESALQKAHHLLLDEVYRKTLAIQIVNARNSCPGDCGNEDKIEALRRQFPDLKLEELTLKMEELEELTQWLEKYLKEEKKV
ncbi:metal-sensitive transcriptional regulator [Pontibacter sp. E15-1]|uniref:metal-sensitive transcriptional regulator n=1 Tax=Pontibacter sp. E15-1 TaxID=2919918 RepID=UPI001F4F3198|nr:metal-sensitive transcriptional regulator [Pontibacter sp. E15-1]MCJ8163269.1 metal-sensitive transcriptional regulator [Pontibacter sp. E15-1]